jgi:hypothetical protein
MINGWYRMGAVRVFAAGVVLAALGCNRSSGLGINEIRKNPSLLQGTVTVQGVVGGISKEDPRIVGVMDVSELKCADPNCGRFYLPVRTGDPVPRIGDEVRITGQLADERGGKVFSAVQVDVVRNHKM